MDWCLTISFVFVTILTAAFYTFWTKSLPVPKVDVDEYWGRGRKEDHVIDESVRSFHIDYPKERIDELKTKLNEKRTFTPPLEGTALHSYGMDTNKLQVLIKYWRDEYLPKWDDRLKLFNSLPHFKTNIQGLDMHFIQTKPKESNGKRVVPVLLLHGWPGSVREFYNFIPLLQQQNDKLDVVFEIIAPSLPGYGWSEATTKTGLSPIKMSVILRNLMLRLGHGQFYIQCGDWGSIIGSNIATLFPQNVLGYHTNMCYFLSLRSMLKLWIANLYPSYFLAKEYHDFHFPAGPWFGKIIEESGYFHIQATKPDTVGAALAGNPIGMAAYILEKFNSFGDTIGYEAIFDNLMIYYLNNIFTTAARLYAESMTKKERKYDIGMVATDVPTGVTRFRADLFFMIDWQIKDKYRNLIHSTYHLKGGHFTAFEVPETLYRDFVEFVQKCEAIKN